MLWASRGHGAAPGEPLRQHRGHVAHARDGQTDARIMEQTTRAVYPHVPPAQRRRTHQFAHTGIGVLSLTRLILRQVQQVHCARLELGHRRDGLGDNTSDARVDGRRATEVARVAGKLEVVATPPFDERPRSRANGLLLTSAPTRSGTTDATGMASSVGKMAGGSSSSRTTVESSTACTPCVLPMASAIARAPRTGYSGHTRPAFVAGSRTRDRVGPVSRVRCRVPLRRGVGLAARGQGERRECAGHADRRETDDRRARRAETCVGDVRGRSACM